MMKLLDAISDWIEAKREADVLRETLRGNYEAGYYWDGSRERCREMLAEKEAEKELKAYILSVVKEG